MTRRGGWYWGRHETRLLVRPHGVSSQSVESGTMLATIRTNIRNGCCRSTSRSTDKPAPWLTRAAEPRSHRHRAVRARRACQSRIPISRRGSKARGGPWNPVWIQVSVGPPGRIDELEDEAIGRRPEATAPVIERDARLDALSRAIPAGSNTLNDESTSVRTQEVVSMGESAQATGSGSIAGAAGGAQPIVAATARTKAQQYPHRRDSWVRPNVRNRPRALARVGCMPRLGAMQTLK